MIGHRNGRARLLSSTALGLLSLWLAAPAGATSLQVKDADGNQITQYHFTLERDETFPDLQKTNDPNSLSVNFHKSYMPVLATGTDADVSTILNDPKIVELGQRYYISVLPIGDNAGATVGGAAFTGGDDVTVPVVKGPLPAAQATFYAFQDTNPINNEPDDELPLAGVTFILEDACGRYGGCGGQTVVDVFGNLLGTEYDADGNITKQGSGVLTTDADGMVTVKNLIPGKYGVIAVPPRGQGWVQTNTIEGTRTFDIWVQPNELTLLNEVGPAGPHAWFGFVKPFAEASVLTGGATVTGTVTNLHTSAPPYYPVFDGGKNPQVKCWAGLNLTTGTTGTGVWAGQCDGNGKFTIPNVPPGNYQLVLWDTDLVNIFAFQQLSVEAPSAVGGSPTCNNGASCALGNIPVNDWFYRLQEKVFYDSDADGFPDPGEQGLAGFPVNLRFRDGTLDQTGTTGADGTFTFETAFPYFNWQIAEVDHAKLMPTGMTAVVDAGGKIPADNGWKNPSFGSLNPQKQAVKNPNTKNKLSRTEQGPALLEGVQGFVGQTSVIQWGVKNYPAGQPGDITGVVNIATTRAENDPAYGVVEDWEPGVARAPLALYPAGVTQASQFDATQLDLADIDNYPFDWQESGVKGPEDIERAKAHQLDPSDHSFHYGDAIAIVHTDGWDDAQPDGCPTGNFKIGKVKKDCFDGGQNFNQIRPGVFDGGYGFVEQVTKDANGNVTGTAPLTAGNYVVEAIPPRFVDLGDKLSPYRIIDEADKNVDFGDEFVPTPELLPPACVGPVATVPATLRIAQDMGLPAGDYPTPNAGPRHSCAMKFVQLRNGQNAVANYSVMTDAPVAGHAVGLVLDDLSNEFDAKSPNFGEKYAPPFMSVALRDWQGTTISRTFTDQFGLFDTLVPSTWTVNVPSPSGVAPNMLSACINDPGPLPDGSIDPHFNPIYSSACYTLPFMPGTTTYLDTPILPRAAFPGPVANNLVCELPKNTPIVDKVTSNSSDGPFVPSGGTLTITGSNFGNAKGTIKIGDVELMVAKNADWKNTKIVATVPAGTPSGELVITRGAAPQLTSLNTVTVSVGVTPAQTVAPGGSIQAAIDAASPGDTILIKAGTYRENLIMWKPVRLQGAGAGSTKLFALSLPSTRLEAYRKKLAEVVNGGAIDLLPGQPVALPDIEGAGVLVLAPNSTLFKDHPAAIDGLTILGTDRGGGVVINAYAAGTQVANNVITANLGSLGGGVVVGEQQLDLDAQNDGVAIHHNMITKNGAEGDLTTLAGGGVAIGAGADNYEVSDNFICGNFAQASGAGIGHLGLSDGGRIEHNTIAFNESFAQAFTAAGGGIFIGGTAGAGIGTPSLGSGSVSVVNNLVHGNLAGAGDGGGLRAERINGAETADPDSSKWYRLDLAGNYFTNNVAGHAGGAISLLDALTTRIVHNTVVNNQSTATDGASFPPGTTGLTPQSSSPNPAGIVSYANSPALTGTRNLSGSPATRLGSAFSDPLLTNNIVYNNRSYFFQIDDVAAGAYQLKQASEASPAALNIQDFAVLPAGTGSMTVDASNVKSCTGGDLSCDTGLNYNSIFVLPLLNGTNGTTVKAGLGTTANQPLLVAAAFDEGGNFIDVRYGPLDLSKFDYHLTGSPAAVVGQGDAAVLTSDLASALATDADGDQRPWTGPTPDIGADEVAGGVAQQANLTP